MHFLNILSFRLAIVYIILSLSVFSCLKKSKSLEFSVSDIRWDAGLGNHRAVLSVERPVNAVKLDLLWRRRDRDPANKRFIIISASTNDTIPNIKRNSVTNERCELIFGPVTTAGKYYFYYLPYKPDHTYGSYMYDYLKPEEPPDNEWLQSIYVNDSTVYPEIEVADCSEIQSRTQFDSFSPMEIIPTQAEKARFLSHNPGDYLVFPEDRKYPIRMKRDIPLKWINDSITDNFSGIAFKNEYYAFQLGIFASQKEVKNVGLEFSDLLFRDSMIPATALTCFNLSGIDPDGKAFSKNVSVPRGQIQSLWIGIDIPEDIKPGLYKGTVMVKPENSDLRKIAIAIKVENKVLKDRGDSEPWRHSRLRWLNSTLGIDDQSIAPYSPVQFDQINSISISGKKILMNKEHFPESIDVYGNEILARPISFTIQTSGKTENYTQQNSEVKEHTEGKILFGWQEATENFVMSITNSIEFDGYINYKIKLKAKKNVPNTSCKLTIPYKSNIGQYMMGMGLPGSPVPDSHEWQWDGPYDSFWIGNTLGGIHCELRGSKYHGPLLSLYKPEYPSSWHNNGKGRLMVHKTASEVVATISTGTRSMSIDEEIEFEFSLLLTPVKKVNYQSQFVDRYYHSGGKPAPSPEDVNTGIKVINVHHANKYIPYINYPFLDTDLLKAFISKWHTQGMKVKIYYTIRELTNHLPELWALRSLDYEILQNGPGGGFPWLREHLRSNYRRQWYHPYEDGGADAALLTTSGDTRWYNYYIEGLAWLVNNLDIDGLYLDDVAFDRRTLKRIRKVLNNHKPDAMIDLHSNTGFSKGPAIQYTEFFPYVDKLWFGESFQYNDMDPANWLVEVSGLPFGLMGDMLQGGGNRWLGMLFGMTVRLPWYSAEVISDPRHVWKFWDEYEINKTIMTGFWDDNCPVQTNDPDVKVTVYDSPERVLLAVGNFSDIFKNVQLSFNANYLSSEASGKQLLAPYIQDFQESSTFYASDIPIESKKGLLLILEK